MNNSIPLDKQHEVSDTIAWRNEKHENTHKKKQKMYRLLISWTVKWHERFGWPHR